MRWGNSFKGVFPGPAAVYFLSFILAFFYNGQDCGEFFRWSQTGVFFSLVYSIGNIIFTLIIYFFFPPWRPMDDLSISITR